MYVGSSLSGAFRRRHKVSTMSQVRRKAVEEVYSLIEDATAKTVGP